MWLIWSNEKGWRVIYEYNDGVRKIVLRSGLSFPRWTRETFCLMRRRCVWRRVLSFNDVMLPDVVSECWIKRLPDIFNNSSGEKDRGGVSEEKCQEVGTRPSSRHKKSSVRRKGGYFHHSQSTIYLNRVWMLRVSGRIVKVSRLWLHQWILSPSLYLEPEFDLWRKTGQQEFFAPPVPHI